MTFNDIITALNKNLDTPNIGSIDLANTDFTAVEKAFIAQYRPEKFLIIYGTLAPNAPNHHVIEHIKGTWQKGIVRGQLEEKGWGADLGYFAFKHDFSENQRDIKAFILNSDELIANWVSLDDFEGEGYKRILAPFELENGAIGVGNIYASNE